MAQAPSGGIVHQDQFPVMNQAITQLQQIREQLKTEAGTHYQGHRVNGMHLIDRAISQLKRGHSDLAGDAIEKAISQLQEGVKVAKAMGQK